MSCNWGVRLDVREARLPLFEKRQEPHLLDRLCIGAYTVGAETEAAVDSEQLWLSFYKRISIFRDFFTLGPKEKSAKAAQEPPAYGFAKSCIAKNAKRFSAWEGVLVPTRPPYIVNINQKFSVSAKRTREPFLCCLSHPSSW